MIPRREARKRREPQATQEAHRVDYLSLLESLINQFSTRYPLGLAHFRGIHRISSGAKNATDNPRNAMADAHVYPNRRPRRRAVPRDHPSGGWANGLIVRPRRPVHDAGPSPDHPVNLPIDPPRRASEQRESGQNAVVRPRSSVDPDARLATVSGRNPVWSS